MNPFYLNQIYLNQNLEMCRDFIPNPGDIVVYYAEIRPAASPQTLSAFVSEARIRQYRPGGGVAPLVQFCSNKTFSTYITVYQGLTKGTPYRIYYYPTLRDYNAKTNRTLLPDTMYVRSDMNNILPDTSEIYLTNQP